MRLSTSLPRHEGGFAFVVSCYHCLLIIGTVALTGPPDGIHPPGANPAGRRFCRPIVAGEGLVH